MIDNLLSGGGLKHVFIYTLASGDDPIWLLCFKWIETKGMCILYFVVSLGKIYKKDTHPPQKKMQICKNKPKTSRIKGHPPVLLPLLFRCPICVISNPTLAQRVLMGFCVVLVKELDGVEVDLGVPHQALTKEVPPGFSRYFGPAPRGLGSVLQRDVSILQLPTTLSYPFCCHLERSSFWKFVRICKNDVETETNDATLFLTGIKCGSNRKVMKMIYEQSITQGSLN